MGIIMNSMGPFQKSPFPRTGSFILDIAKDSAQGGVSINPGAVDLHFYNFSDI